MTSEVSICAAALTELGDKPISSFLDPTDAARACSIIYPFVRDEVLRVGWNSCTGRVLLAPLAETPAFDYPYQFQLPADWLRTIQVGRRGDSLGYAAEGLRILAHVQALPLVYVRRNDVVSTWESTLIGVMRAAMRAALAYPITQSASMKQLEEQKLIAILKQAKALNGQDDDTETLGDFPLIASRIAGYYSRAPGR
ncbi:hypothetical protein [Burkholderia latens]|uniref:hypothetical protein n=1 Tax=Burkholderia latens TaxID=488446 RepID=UPI001AE45F9E|nr:hypothetical protein [Burkholderia latens]QTO42183.1 hypothetical protein J8I85_08750 [Burkholderia latens]